MNLTASTVVSLCFFCIAQLSSQNTNKPVPQSTGKNPVLRRPIVAPPNPVADAERLNNVGVGYMNQQQFEKALSFFRLAYAKNPRLTIARLNQAVALLNAQKLDQSKTILLEIVRKDRGNARAWYNLGLLYKGEGKPTSALEAFERVARLDPKDADTFYFLGTLHFQLKEYRSAVAAFEQALKLNPHHASAEFGLARAYQQSEDSAQARQHLARFQQITASKLGVPISVAYGEQGPYSLAATSSGIPDEILPAIPVKFVDVTAEAGLPTSATQKQNNGIHRFLDLAGPGACFFDYDNDAHPDLFLGVGGSGGGAALYHNSGNGGFENVTAAMGLDAATPAISCAAGDYDNDGFTDLAVSYADHVVLYHNQGGKKFRDVTKATEIISSGNVLGITFLDYDHDGDLDLYVTQTPNFRISSRGEAYQMPADEPATHNVLWRNNGNGTFADVTDATGLAAAGSSISAVATDFNNDRAVDFVVTGWQQTPTIFVNPREGKFQPLKPWVTSIASPTAGAAVLDFNKDAWMDLAFTHLSSPGISLWRNIEGHRFENIPLPETGWTHGRGVAALDYDNDGWIDLAAVGETPAGRGEIRLFRNIGPNRFKDVTADVGLDRIELHAPRALIAADYDADGTTDLLMTQNQGPPVLLRNEGPNRNHWMQVSLKGLNDNKSAIGTKVEVFAGALHQKFEVQGGSGYLGQSSFDLNIGLGEEKKADLLRLLWPTGVVQDEVQLASGRRQQITEIDRRGSSCPTLFAWDGHQFRFIADMLGAGVVGHWVGPGERNVPRPVEYVKVDGTLVRPLHGRFMFRFMEPMEEVVYLDQVQLLAVDHPAGVDVYPNESFLSNPPYPEFKVVASKDARPPAGARDDKGRDVLPQLLRKDRRYVTGFSLLPFAGFAQPHTLELDLGEPYRNGPLRLLMHGFVDYFTANSMYAADQAGLKPIAPYLEAFDGNGKWVRVLDDMGFPAGLPRTMVADLSGRLPDGTKRIRIGTNLQVYWDQVLIDRPADRIPVNINAVPLNAAALRFHGYPRQVVRSLPGDIDFLYHDASATGPYARESGHYTAYGNVLPLVSSADDRFVVFGSGEEVALDFDSTTLPSLPKGWVRDYFFMARGYEKDMDFYAADANTVAPLPYRKMPHYPYGAEGAFPSDDLHLNYLLQYNTRELSGNTARSYRFAFPATRPRRRGGN